MVIHFNDDPVHGTQSVALNYREMAPGAVGRDYYVKSSEANASTLGGTAVGVPGTVAGLLYALETYGTLDRAVVMEPAIRAAADGFAADANYVSTAQSVARSFESNPSYKERFASVWTTFLHEGEIEVGDLVLQPAQARALELIAEHGASVFYEGEIADAIVRTVRGDGGEMTLGDLAGYRVDEVEPLTFGFGDWRIVGMPPPSSGGLAMAQTLNLLERHLEMMGDGPPDTAQYIHAVVEAMKHAFADRAEWLGDPNYVDVPVEALLSDSYLELNATMFSAVGTHSAEAYGSKAAPPDDGGTSHFSVVDKRGNAVACTETINTSFGSKLPVDGFGFCLNNELDDFTAKPGVPNAYGLTQSDRNSPAPGKRPLSSMSPTIVLDAEGEVVMVAGAAGGPKIITSTLELVLQVLVADASAAEAMDAARFHHQWSPDVLQLEGGWYEMQPDVVAKLEALGHVVKRSGGLAAANLVRRARDGKGWDASGDPRKGGIPAGY